MKAVPLVVLSLGFALSLHADFREDKVISARVDESGVEQTSGCVHVHFDANVLTSEQRSGFAELADKGAMAIASFTGIDEPAHIDVYVVRDDLVSHTFPHWPASRDHNPRVFLAAGRVEHHRAPYLHELVHAVVGDGGAVWLEEGYASYVASEVSTHYGGYYAPVLSRGNDRVDAQAAAIIRRESPDQLAKELEWIRGDTEPSFAHDEERTSFYILSHSFTKFLAERLGLKTLTAIHRRNDIEELARRTGKTSSAWRQEWVRKLSDES